MPCNALLRARDQPGNLKADALQNRCGIAAKFAEPHDADRDLTRRRLIVLEPDAVALLRIVEPLPAMEHQRVQHDVFGHALRQVAIDDPHDRHIRKCRIADEMIDAGAEREDRFEIWKAVESAPGGGFHAQA